MEKETIINHLSALEKKEIIAYLESAWDNMTDKQLRQVFGKLYKKLTFKPAKIVVNNLEYPVKTVVIIKYEGRNFTMGY